MRDAGGLTALGSDSHITLPLGNFDRVLEIAQIDFPHERILNVTQRRVLDFFKITVKKRSWICHFNIG